MNITYRQNGDYLIPNIIIRKTTNDDKLLAILEKKYEENKNNP